MGLEAINRIRKLKGMSIDELSSKSGVPKGTLSKISAGITKNPNLETVKAIAKALGCTLDDLDDDENRLDIVNSEIQNLSEKESQLIKKYRLLDQRGQQTVDDTVNRELSYILPNKNMVDMSVIAADAANTIDKITEAMTKNQHNSVLKK